jgi:hypothetical protein
VATQRKAVIGGDFSRSHKNFYRSSACPVSGRADDPACRRSGEGHCRFFQDGWPDPVCTFDAVAEAGSLAVCRQCIRGDSRPCRYFFYSGYRCPFPLKQEVRDAWRTYVAEAMPRLGFCNAGDVLRYTCPVVAGVTGSAEAAHYDTAELLKYTGWARYLLDHAGPGYTDTRWQDIESLSHIARVNRVPGRVIAAIAQGGNIQAAIALAATIRSYG